MALPLLLDVARREPPAHCRGLPVLTATLAIACSERYHRFHFFNDRCRGTRMMYVNLFWVWGPPESLHPGLPRSHFFPRCSDILRQAAFAIDPWSPPHDSICVLHSWLCLAAPLLLHHGRRCGRQWVLGLTMIIAVPTASKSSTGFYDVRRAHALFTVPILWSIWFMVTFVDRRHGTGRFEGRGLPPTSSSAQQPVS